MIGTETVRARGKAGWSQMGSCLEWQAKSLALFPLGHKKSFGVNSAVLLEVE